MEMVERARRALAASRSGRIAPAEAAELAAKAGGMGAALLGLIALAAEHARPAISGYRVGAVGEGVSGALYLGANLEFEGAALGQTVHAEQAVVANAAAHREPGLVRLAVSAPPCGHCRQFLYELAGADRLEILLDGRLPTPLASFLPAAFGPADLGIEGRMLAAAERGLDIASPIAPDALARAAAAAANRSYAPYSGAYGGVALRMGDSTVFTGAYQENAAFNPSLHPLQAALVAAVLAGYESSDVAAAAIAQPADARVDHAAAARALLKKLAPAAQVTAVPLEAPAPHPC